MPSLVGSAVRARSGWPFFLLALAVMGCVRASALDWEAGNGFRTATLAVPATGKPGFTTLSPEMTGVHFTNYIAESRHLTNQILLNGAGVAAGDVDGDGWCDLYFCSLQGANRLYRNLGNWKFEELTDSAGVACSNLTSTGAALADLDGNGSLDLIVNTFGNGTHVFFNDGKGRYTEAGTVLNPGKGAMSLALADVDGDGYLDLYVANYRTSALMDMPNARATFKRVDGKLAIETVNGRPMTEPDLADRFSIGPRGEIEEHGEVDVLYHNSGGTNLVPVSFTGGSFLDEEGKPLAQPPRDWGLSAMFRDINGDGLPDLYVCNDFQTPDRFWINQGEGKFRLLPRLSQRKSSLFSMAVDFADINRDGFDDFLVLDMLSRDHQQRMRYLGDKLPPIPVVGRFDDRPQYGLNTLFLNRGDDTFAEIAQLSGLKAAEWSWSCVFLDVDLDGWEDLLVVNGMERAARDMDVADYLKQFRAQRSRSAAEIFQARRMFPRLANAKLAFRNRGDLTFEEAGHAWGFDWQGVSQGMALADLDNDGDLDVAVNNMNAVAGLLRNDSPAPRIAVRLNGQPPNTRGIGARIRVWGGAVPFQSQEMICGGRYLSSDDPVRTFAAGTPTNQLKIEVTWRSGRQSVLTNGLPNHVYQIDEAAATPAASVPSRRPALSALPWFEDASRSLDHTHHEEDFNDFSRQPLLPNKLSQLGPGVAWFDLDGDGWEDLIIASGKGGQLGVFHNDGHGAFQAWTQPPFNAPVTRDQTTVLGWNSATNRPVILVGAANYEDGLAIGAAVRQYQLADQTVDESLPATESSTGPLALADVDGDGDLDLFVGGRVIGARYPYAASSRLFRNQEGKFALDAENTEVLNEAGLVSGAVFSDVDGNGYPDLVLACEWGPIRIFMNAGGRFTEWSAPLVWPAGAAPGPPPATLDQLTGWWTGVNAGDFDGDGRIDLVAGNWGRNTPYEAYRRQPLRLYYGDFDGDGTVDLIEAHYDPPLGKIVPERQLDVLARALPFLRGQFNSHRAYSVAGIEDILGDRLQSARVWNANWLESTLFLNRGDHLEPRSLPLEAQMAPAFAVCIGDFDGDGNEDLVLSQNFFDAQLETPRYDAGRALCLRGDGQGGLRALAGQESGLKVYGEQRGAAVADYDGDGRLDLVVSQNGAATELFHNVGAKPGLRVRLAGPTGNPAGGGAALRLVFDQRMGPIREIHAGSGYWSQDSAIQVMSGPTPPTGLWVRWPGGKTTSVSVPAEAKAIVLDEQGRLRADR